MNDTYVNFTDPIKLAKYLAELTRQEVTYLVIRETDKSFSIRITGY